MQLCDTVKNQFGCVANMHLTCTNQTASLAEDALAKCKAVGVRNICALRGDPPRGSDKWEASEGGFQSAEDLCKYITKHHGDYFSTAVAGYPEGHPDNIDTIDGDVDAAVASLSEAEKKRYAISTDEAGKKIVTVKDVEASKFISAFAQHLKRQGRFEIPKWADVVKTGTLKELAPTDPDWLYVRTASIVRKVYIRGGSGVGAFPRISALAASPAPQTFSFAPALGAAILLRAIEFVPFFPVRVAASPSLFPLHRL